MLPSSASGRTLGLADIFATEGTWKEQRYDISDTRGIFGMATTLYCNNSAQLELRLAHNFTKLKFDVGQANDSATADNTVIVDVIEGQTKIDSKPLPFDTVLPFEEDITGANSLKLEFHPDPKCEDKSVTVVVSGLTVS